MAVLRMDSRDSRDGTGTFRGSAKCFERFQTGSLWQTVPLMRLRIDCGKGILIGFFLHFPMKGKNSLAALHFSQIEEELEKVRHELKDINFRLDYLIERFRDQFGP